MKEKFEFETPMLEKAHFGQFVAGASGEGGSEIIAEANRVLKEVFPELKVEIHIPDETFKRHGQAVIAASL